MRSRRFTSAVTVALALGAAACGLVEQDRPTPQPDTTIFGVVLEVQPQPDAPGTSVVTLRTAPPRALNRAQEERGRPTPVVEDAVTAEITVGPDTVVLADGEPVAVEELTIGTEVVAVPAAGTTRMVGGSTIMLEAAYLTDFPTYSRWQLPNLAPPRDEAAAGDPGRINSPGIESSPVPVGDGTVLYFTARWRRPWEAGGEWFGAAREGLPAPEGGVDPLERTYRTELGDDGWSTPELVRFEGLESAQDVSVSWVDADETRCLVTVREADGEPWVGRSTRTEGGGWGPVEPVSDLGRPAHAAVRLAGSTDMIAFASDRGGLGGSDLYLYQPQRGPDPQMLEPTINTPANEWSPRVGPQNALLFCRQDRQLLFSGGTVQALRLPGQHRIPFTQANPSHDGGVVFFCRPELTPVEQDLDIWVAAWDGSTTLGAPVPVDEWRP